VQLLCNQDNPLQPFYRRIALPAWIVRKSRTVAAEAALTGYRSRPYVPLLLQFSVLRRLCHCSFQERQ
jgi:hypothetical protein